MTPTQREELNRFFVRVFNQILAREEQALSGAGGLSVKELHVLEAVSGCAAQGRNTMTQIAGALSIRVSTLTTAVNTLVSKGCLERGEEPGDRRVVRVRLTARGEEASRLHARFHQRMVESAAGCLEEDEVEILLRSLRRLEQFFRSDRTDQ